MDLRPIASSLPPRLISDLYAAAGEQKRGHQSDGAYPYGIAGDILAAVVRTARVASFEELEDLLDDRTALWTEADD